VVTGLPDAPAITATLDVGGAAPGSLAISDDGAFLLFAAGGSALVAGTTGGSRRLMDVGDGVLTAFAPAGHDAAVADPTGAGVVLFRDVAGAATRSLLAPPDDSIASPAGLAFSTDGGRLYLASSSARSVTVFRLATGDRSVTACNCTPTALAPTGDLFRLNAPGAGPLWMLDAGRVKTQIFFVPAAQ
jgi:DNA-binding beta-propeller fold protein YncE